MTLRNKISIALLVWFPFTTHTMVPVLPSITCSWAVSSRCHHQALSCFRSVMNGFDTPQAQVRQLRYEAISGGEIAVWSVFEVRRQPKVAARCRFMDRFTSWGITTKAVSKLLHAAFFAIGSMLGTIYSTVHWISYTAHHIWRDTWGKKMFFSSTCWVLTTNKGAIFMVLQRMKDELHRLISLRKRTGVCESLPDSQLAIFV